jgi:hypothetical protein
MSGATSHLYGRQGPTALVREFMTRPERDGYPTSRPVPIIVFTGSRGCGKTALVNDLADQFTGQVPYARIDCGSLRTRDPWDVLTLLVFDFNRSAAGYRRIPFPRYVTAQVAMAENLDLNNITAAREQIQRAIERHRRVDKLRDFLATLARRLVQALAGPGSPPGIADTASYAPGLLLHGLISQRWGRRVMLGEGTHWYGEQPIDELVRLNRLTRPTASPADKHGAAELLWKAFLADLRAAFGKGRGARAWSLNCPVLLDNVDSDVGETLLDGLVKARRQHAVHQHAVRQVDEPDPLTVVATSTGEIVRQFVAQQVQIPSAEEASYDDYLKRMRADRDRDWYPVGLRDLTLEEVVGMVSAVGGAWRSADRRIAGSVYRLTRGHPGATAELVDAIANNTGGPAPIKNLLDTATRVPRSENPADADDKPKRFVVEDKILADLRGELKEEVINRLVICSAACDVKEAELLASDSGLVTLRDAAETVPPELRTKDVFTGRTTMLPVLRHLLLRRLAGQSEKWSAAHGWLRDNGAESMPAELYHALATRDVAAVTAWLTDRLGDASVDIADWLADLYSITSAPSDLHDNGDPDSVLKAIGWAGPNDGAGGALARLVVALWIANDPLSDVDRKALYSAAKLDLQTVAQDAPRGRHDLRNEALWLDNVAKAPDDAAVIAGIRPPRERNAPPAHPHPIETPQEVSFRPPVLRREQAYKQRLRAAVAAGISAVLVAAGLLGLTALNGERECGTGVAQLDGECIGVSDGSFVFDDANLAAVEKLIHAENQAVESQTHVTLALLTPLTPTSTGSVTPERVRAQIEGAYVAQQAANATSEPKIKLLLANPGSRQQGWRHVINELQDLVDAPDNLVGVIGLVPSTRTTQEIMRELAAKNLPMVGTLVTAADINKVTQPDGRSTYIEGFTRVSPTTRDQVTALSQYLDTTPRRAMLLYDIDEENLFASSLRKEFEAAEDASGGRLSITVLNRYDTEASLDNQFAAINGDLCGDGAPDTVLYAGRAALLDSLIRNLRDRSCARDGQSPS